METDIQEHVAYYLTGSLPEAQPEKPDTALLRPALFARYPDLDEIRYDIPLILVDDASADGPVVSLSRLFDSLMDGLVDGVEPSEARRLRHHAIRLEGEIRRVYTAGGGERLSQLWSVAAEGLHPQHDEVLNNSLERVQAACSMDGQVIGCDADLPRRLIGHLWRTEDLRRARNARARIDRLALGLTEILFADDANSPAGTSAERLNSGFGPAFATDFDFGVMSHVLGESRPGASLPAARRERIEGLLATLRSQRFFAATEQGTESTDPHGFVFDSCAEAVRAFRGRQPEMISVAKAVRMAELEVDGAYRADAHDQVFDALDSADLSPSEIAAFPDYLVVMDSDELMPDEWATMAEALAEGVPVKVLLQLHDLAGRAARSDDKPTVGDLVRQMAHAAVATGGVHVVQTTGSHMYRVFESLNRGVEHTGPTLFCVYTGASGYTDHLPPYLVAAAAVESRAFPVFTFDPSAGPDWASRFSVEANPQPEQDWPRHEVTFQDGALQRAAEEVSFTYVDFLACDTRIAGRLVRVPHERWGDGLVPVADRVAADDEGTPRSFPYVVMAGEDASVLRALVDRRLIQQARRCLDQWHSLRELGGIRNSFAERLLAHERQVWEEQALLEAEAREAEAATTGAAAIGGAPSMATAEPGAAIAEGEVAAAPARDPDVTAIETPRCSTCDECTKLNNRMFKYNANKQAYIADLAAGTYAEMVQAAERCQVAIIHPGKPWNADEPGLEELLERAAPFR